LLAELTRFSNSCARPNPRRADPSRPQPHCGYCVPCIIRRAAMATVAWDDPQHYRYDVRSERAILDQSTVRRSDVRAFEIAIVRARYRANIIDVLRAGPLPPDDADRYETVYRNGLAEVARFLTGATILA
jgi:hypothetical protein